MKTLIYCLILSLLMNISVGTKEVIMFAIVVIMAFIAAFSDHYRGIFNHMVGVITALFVPICLMVLAIAFIGGAKFMTLAKMPGIGIVFTILVVVIIAGGFIATVGNDINEQLTGNSVKVTDLIFTRDALNAGFVLLFGIIMFVIILVKHD